MGFVGDPAVFYTKGGGYTYGITVESGPLWNANPMWLVHLNIKCTLTHGSKYSRWAEVLLI